jgi:RNA polymerase sigma-70 factor, ECF subfamily
LHYQCDEVVLRAANAERTLRAGPRAPETDFTVIYERHAASLLRYAIGFVRRREIAEELASDALLALYRNLHDLDPEHRVPWLFRVLKNLAVDYWRRNTIEHRHCESLAAVDAVTSLPPEIENALLDRTTLKPEHRACLTLRYVHGMQRKEIAEHTGMTENQVKSCLQYGLELLRKSLAENSRARR